MSGKGSRVPRLGESACGAVEELRDLIRKPHKSAAQGRRLLLLHLRGDGGGVRVAVESDCRLRKSVKASVVATNVRSRWDHDIVMTGNSPGN